MFFVLRIMPCVILLSSGGSAFAGPKKVTLATLEWEPYIGTKLAGKGYVYEIVDQAFKSVGYEVTISFLSWSKALSAARQGKVDGLFPEYIDQKRQSEFAFSDPIPGGPVGFMARKDRKITFPVDPRQEPDKAFLAMKQYRFGVVQEYINTKEFDAATYLKKDVAYSDEINVRKLCFKRIDLIFIDQFVAQHLLSTSVPECAQELEFLDPPLEVKSLYIAFGAKAPNRDQKRRDFNRGLEILEKSGKLEELMKRRGY